MSATRNALIFGGLTLAVLAVSTVRALFQALEAMELGLAADWPFDPWEDN